MKKLEITEEKVLEAANKCSTAKEILNTLFPEVFKEVSYNNCNIYAIYVRELNEIYKLHLIDETFAFISISGSIRRWNSLFDSPNKALNSIKGIDIQSFDNHKDFFEWALKQIKS